MRVDPRAGAAFRECLLTGDADRLARIWREVFPGMPAPATPEGAAVILHQARTESETIPMPLRLYSHEWLLANGYHSRLPSRYRPGWDAGVITPAVGIAVKPGGDEDGRREEAKALEVAMVRKAGDMVRDGITDRATIHPELRLVRKAFKAGKLRRVI